MTTLADIQSTKHYALVLCPHPQVKGGVTGYYSLVRKYYSSERVDLDFFPVGRDTGVISPVRRCALALSDICKLFRVLPRYDLVILNPSLDLKSVIRDGIYNFIARRLFRKRTLVFFHGWNDAVASRIEKNGTWLFRRIFDFDRGVVLASQFKKTLVAWGFDPAAIGLETTVYEESHHEGRNNPLNILFLSRFAKGKGCLETIQAVELLSKRLPEIRLYMAGDGELSAELRDYVVRKGLTGLVEFTGWVDDEAKRELLNRCGIMLFPTSYGEGMPLCILEGMGMGLAIVTRPVAGIPDVIADGVHGFLVPSLDPGDFAEMLAVLIDDDSLWSRISEENRHRAREMYEVRSVVKRLEELYFTTCNSCGALPGRASVSRRHE